MAKKRSARVKHKTLKLSPHNYSQQQVYIYIAVAIAVGLVLGYLLKDQAIAVLGVSTY